MLSISLYRYFKGYYKLCQCGCKGLTNIFDKQGRIKKFIHGHNNRNKRINYKNGKTKRKDGYIMIRKPYFIYSDSNNYVMEHRYVYYIYLSILNGKPTYIEGLSVHHINGNKTDNLRPDLNMQLLTRSEHQKLHKLKT